MTHPTRTSDATRVLTLSTVGFTAMFAVSLVDSSAPMLALAFGSALRDPHTPDPRTQEVHA